MATFCEPAAGTITVDGVTGLPGPGALVFPMTGVDQVAGRNVMRHSAALAATPLALVCLAPLPLGATHKFGPIPISGSVQSANIVRTPDAHTLQ